MKRKKLFTAVITAAAILAGTFAPAQLSEAAWHKNSVGWWWSENNGYAANEWKEINGTWYWFDARGYMVTGWQKIGTEWYYFANSGAMLKNRWVGNYYLGAGGAMLKNTWVGNYYVGANGAWIPGYSPAKWILSNGRWWYRHSDGSYTRSAWEKIGGNWYYFDKSGWMCANQWVGNYYVGPSGAMLTNTWIGNSYVGNDGLWVPDAKKPEESTEHIHNYILSKTVNATCTADGYKEYKCEGCGDTYRTDMSKTGHDYVEKIVDATCTEDGYEKYTCTRCNDSYQINRADMPKKGHKYTYTRTVNATCTKDGFKQYVCDRCGRISRDPIPKTAHNYVLSQTVNATCTTGGYEIYTCSGCGSSYSSPLDKLEHDYSVLVEHKDSTCTEKGYDIYKCKNCGDISKKDHDQLKHSMELVDSDLQYKYYQCSNCGETSKEYNDQEYTVDLGNGETTTVVGHYELGMADEIFELLNAYRKQVGVEELRKPSAALQNAVNIRAYEIVNKFDHYRPNGERALISFLYSTGCCAENIAKYQSNAQQVMEAWKNSSGHNQNMVSDYPRTVAIGVFAEKVRVVGTKTYYYYNYVQFFGR